jgi:hypothetical protein
VRSYLAGEIHYAIYDSNGFYRYNLHITISPKPPVVKTISNYEGRAMLLDNMNFDTQISYSQAGIVNVYRA